MGDLVVWFYLMVLGFGNGKQEVEHQPQTDLLRHSLVVLTMGTNHDLLNQVLFWELIAKTFRDTTTTDTPV